MDLRNKTVNFLGDSITEGVGVNDKEHCRYDNRLMEMLGIKAANNCGVSGTRIAYQKKPSLPASFDLTFCGRAQIMPRADFVVVYGGVNDYLHGDADIGNDGDCTPATFYGAVEYLMAFLEKEYAGRVLFVTPAKTYFRNTFYDEISEHEAKGQDALPLKGYVDIICATARRHKIPVLNLYEQFVYDPKLHPELINEITSDGLHFNDKGHELLAIEIANRIVGL